MAANQIQQILVKRGNTASISTYTGPLGELVLNTQTNQLVAQDGVTPGGRLVTGDTFPIVANLTVLQREVSNIAGISGNVAQLEAFFANVNLEEISTTIANIQLAANSSYANANAAAYLPVYGGTVGTSLINFTNSNGQIVTGQAGTPNTSWIEMTANIHHDISGFYADENAAMQIYSAQDIIFIANTVGSAPQWTFGADGNTTLPATTGRILFPYDTNTNAILDNSQDSGQYFIIQNNLADGYQGINLNTDDAQVTISSKNAGGHPLYVWNFDWQGQLTYPDSTIQTTAYQGPAGQTSFATQANVTTANTAMKGYVDNQITLLVNNAPAILDTLGQIAANLQADESSLTRVILGQAAANTQISALQANVGSYYIWANANTAGLYNSILGANTAWTANAATQQGLITNLQANIGGFYTWANANFGTSSYGNANVAAYLIANPQAGTYSNANVVAMLNANSIVTIGNINPYPTQSNITQLFVGGNTVITSGGGASGGATEILNNAYWNNAGVLTARNTYSNGAMQIIIDGASLSISAQGSATANTATGMGTRMTLNSTALSTFNSVGINSAGTLTASGTLAVNGSGGITTTQTTIPVLNTTATTINFGGAATSVTLGASTVNLNVGSGTGNITAGNLISNNFLYPNGISILSGIGGTYSNTNVASYIAATTFSAVGASVLNSVGQINGTAIYLQTNGSHNFYFDSTGNLVLPTGGYINYANGQSILTGITAGAGTYSNANVTAYLSNSTASTANIYAGNLIASGNVYGQTFVGNIVTGANVTASYFITTGTYGNISQVNTIFANNYVYANGVSILNGITAGAGTYSNANVAAYLTTQTFYSNANVAAYLIANPQGGVYSNANVIANLQNLTTNVVTSANVQAAYFVGNGAALSGLNYASIGNIYGASSNVTLQAGSYSWTFDNTGNLSIPTHGNIIWANGTVFSSGTGGSGSSGTLYTNANVVSMLAANSSVFIGNINTYPIQSNITQLFIGNSTTLTSGNAATPTSTFLMYNAYFAPNGAILTRNTTTGVGYVEIDSTGIGFGGYTGAVTANTVPTFNQFLRMNGSIGAQFSGAVTSGGLVTGVGLTSTNGLTLNTLGQISTNQTSATIFATTATSITIGGSTSAVTTGGNLFAGNNLGTSTGNLNIRAQGNWNVLTVYGVAGGYNSPPYTNQALTGGSGTGMLANYSSVGGYISTITVSNPGTGYKNGDILTVPGGLGSTVILSNYNPTVSGTLGGASSFTFTMDGSLLLPGNVTHASNSFIFGDFTNSTVNNRTVFAPIAANSNPGIYAAPTGTGTAASWQAANSRDLTNTSKILIATNGTTDVQLVSGINGTGTYLPLSFYTNGTNQMQLGTGGNLLMVTGGNIATTGNIIAGNIVGNQYGNSIGTTATYSGNVTIGGNIITTGATSGNISGANVISANTLIISSTATTGNLTVNGSGYFNGPFIESDTRAGVFVGNAGSGVPSPRVGFYTGNTALNWEIDNYGGQFRWFNPGATRLTLDAGGNLFVTGNLVMSTGQQINSTAGSNANVTIDPDGTGVTNIIGSTTISGNLTVNGTPGITEPNRTAFRVYGQGGAIALNANLTASNWTVDYTQGAASTALNGTTGVFTANVAGLYQTTLTARTSSNTNASIIQAVVRQKKAGVTSIVFMIEWGVNTTFNHASGSSTVKLAAGDQLWVQCLADGGTGGFNFDGNDHWDVVYLG